MKRILLLIFLSLFLIAVFIRCFGGIIGVSLTAEDLSPTGMTLTVTNYGALFTGNIDTGRSYFIQRLNEGQWEMIPCNADIVWPMDAIILNGILPYTFQLDWSDLYGSLPPGEYRIGKRFYSSNIFGYENSQVYYAEFEITTGM